MVAQANAITTIVGVAFVAGVVAEPSAEFELQATNPFVLELREWLNTHVSREVLAVGEAAEAVVEETIGVDVDLSPLSSEDGTSGRTPRSGWPAPLYKGRLQRRSHLRDQVHKPSHAAIAPVRWHSR